MPIPDFETLMLPVLRLASDGAERSMAEMRERIAAEFKLTPEDLAEKQKSGSGGKALLSENPPEITTKTLLVWRPNGEPAPGADAMPAKETEKALTPDEQIERSYLDLRDALARDILGAVKKMSPKAFEQVVVEVLVAMGYGGALEALERW